MSSSANRFDRFSIFHQTSDKQAGLELLRDRRLEMALKKVGRLGDDLEQVSELLEELGGKVRTRGIYLA